MTREKIWQFLPVVFVLVGFQAWRMWDRPHELQAFVVDDAGSRHDITGQRVLFFDADVVPALQVLEDELYTQAEPFVVEAGAARGKAMEAAALLEQRRAPVMDEALALRQSLAQSNAVTPAQETRLRILTAALEELTKEANKVAAELGVVTERLSDRATLERGQGMRNATYALLEKHKIAESVTDRYGVADIPLSANYVFVRETTNDDIFLEWFIEIKRGDSRRLILTNGNRSMLAVQGYADWMTDFPLREGAAPRNEAHSLVHILPVR